MLSSVSVAWSDILSSIRRSQPTGAAGNGAMCNKLKMIALLEMRLELDRRNHGKNGHHLASLQSFSHVPTLSDSRTTLTASLALAFTVELSLLSVEEQENRGHGWYMQ